MDLLHEEKEPIEWRSLHVGAEKGANCEHMQALCERGVDDQRARLLTRGSAQGV